MKKKKNDVVLSLQFTTKYDFQTKSILNSFRDYFESANHLRAVKHFVRYRYPDSLDNCIEFRINMSEINKYFGVYYGFGKNSNFIFQLIRLDKDIEEEMDNTDHIEISCESIVSSITKDI